MYKKECQECKHVYIGETHRTMHDRISEHWDDLNNKREENPLVKHAAIHHNGIPPTYTCKAIKTYRTSLSRQIGEALAINNTDARILMNSKAEFGQNSIPRISIEGQETKDDSAPAQTIPRATRSNIIPRHAPEVTVPSEDQIISRKRPRVTQSCSLPTGPIRTYFRPIPANLSLKNDFNSETAQEQSIGLDQNSKESQQNRAISGERPINPRTQVRKTSQSH